MVGASAGAQSDHGRRPARDSVNDLIDIERLERRLPELVAAYRDAAPFPHIVIDDVLLPDALEAAYVEFDAIGEDTWRKYLHVNERKYANTDARPRGGRCSSRWPRPSPPTASSPSSARSPASTT